MSSVVFWVVNGCSLEIARRYSKKYQANLRALYRRSQDEEATKRMIQFQKWIPAIVAFLVLAIINVSVLKMETSPNFYRILEADNRFITTGDVNTLYKLRFDETLEKRGCTEKVECDAMRIQFKLAKATLISPLTRNAYDMLNLSEDEYRQAIKEDATLLFKRLELGVRIFLEYLFAYGILFFFVGKKASGARRLSLISFFLLFYLQIKILFSGDAIFNHSGKTRSLFSEQELLDCFFSGLTTPFEQFQIIRALCPSLMAFFLAVPKSQESFEEKENVMMVLKHIVANHSKLSNVVGSGSMPQATSPINVNQPQAQAQSQPSPGLTCRQICTNCCVVFLVLIFLGLFADDDDSLKFKVDM